MAVAVGVATGSETDGDGAGDAVAEGDAVLGPADAVGDATGPALAVAEGETTTPDGAVVGFRGLFPVTLPPPEEQDAALQAAIPATSASITRLNMESPNQQEKRLKSDSA